MAKVLASSTSPRPYIVQTYKGTQIRRNRSALVPARITKPKLPEDLQGTYTTTELQKPSRETPMTDGNIQKIPTPITTTVESSRQPAQRLAQQHSGQVTTSGRSVKPPQRLIQNI